MKRKFSKTIAFCMALAMILTCFAGCGNKKTNIENTGAPLVLNGDKIYPIQCDDTLDYWLNSGVKWQQVYENFGETPLGKEIAKVTGVKINYMHPQAGQGGEQLQILMASDELPDIVKNDWSAYPGGPEAALKDGYILKLNDIIGKYMPGLKKVLDENEEWDKNSKTDENSYFTVPMFLEPGILQVSSGPALRADMLKKVGMEPPKTIDEWEKVLRAFKDAGVESPFIGTVSGLITVFSPGFDVSSNWYRNGDEIVYGYTQPGFKELLKTLNKWYNEGLIDPDMATIDDELVKTKLLNNQAGSAWLWCGSGMGTLLAAESDRNKFDLVGTQYPSPEKGKNPEYGNVSKTTSISAGVAISNNCKNIELAARFLDFGFTEEGHNLFNFGIEGVSYNWVDKDGEKYPQYSDLILNNPEGMSVGDAMDFYMRSSTNGLMVKDKRYMEQYYTTEQQRNAQLEWMKTNMNEHILPNIYVLPEEADIDANIMANVKTYVDEMILKFITGAESIENFDKYVEQVNKFGLEESVKFRQNAYDRFAER